ncbi:MATE family efflux transporter [Nevskia soli]|uniref:MATE family efflux transporter n=1 Tax=Nevskia soli TaxID=418856 RepID=UPI0004A74BBA|nr:MATE family efflux transporter [Nevskia soli]
MSQPSSSPVSAAVRTEIRANLKLALPLIAAQLAGVGMGAIDTIFAGRLGAQALAAVAVGVNFNVIFFVLFMGLFMACSPVVAHMVGAGRPQADIGAFIRKASRFAWIAGAVWVLLLNLSAAPALRQLNLDPRTTDLAITFVRALSGSGFGLSLWFTLRFSAEGLGQVRPILYAGLVGLLCNAVLDWLLLFGHFGMPRLGAPGCGVATTVSSLAMAGVLQWQFGRRAGLREVMRASANGAVCAEGVREILRIGTPIGLILLAEAGLFVTAAMLMAEFGDTTVAAYQVAINFASMVFMIPVGVALATTVRVGHAAGAGQHRTARFRGFVGMGLGLANAASNAAIMALFGGVIAGFYTADAGIAAEATYFMLLAAAFQFFDGLQATANGALRGVKDTRLPMLITLVSYWLVGMPVAWWLAFHGGLGPGGLWWGLTAGLGAASIGLSLRYWLQTRHAAEANRSELMA